MPNNHKRRPRRITLGRSTVNRIGRLRPPELSRLGKLLAAPAATLLALIVQYAMLPHPATAPFVFFFMSVAVAAWLAGRAAGLAAVVLGAVTANYFFLSGIGWTTVRSDLAAEALFVISASGVALLCGSLRVALVVAETTARRLRESDTRYADLFQSSRDAIFATNGDGEIIEANPAALAILKYEPSELLGLNYRKLLATRRTGFGADPQHKLGEDYDSDEYELEYLCSDGTPVPVSVRVWPRRHEKGQSVGFWIFARDVSVLKRSSEALIRSEIKYHSLEEQLHQSQKMEAMGRLAGGVAHDFNNLLTGISGNLSLALMDIEGQDHVLDYLGEAVRAVDSAASLTRQLLAFSRKQIVAPRVFDLNEVIQNMYKMLSRIIGDDIVLKACPVIGVAPVKVDPSQLEQVLVNLAVNARDAMPNGGNLTLETALVTLDGIYASAHPGVTPGSYVMLAVSDTGCGMSEEISSRCFEPFFTTKSKDKGTGLGLSTIYGIIKQASGSVEIYSEKDRGTTVKIYLPHVDERTEEFSLPAPSQSLPHGTETVLLVEDDLAVRNVALRLLQRLGYRMLNCVDPADALKIARDYPGEIHLLLTDVVMPGMNGRQLADELRGTRPNMKVLFTSGYTEEVIVHHGVLDSGIYFIGKPYAVRNLATKVREVLDVA
jgi:PAS domain S-box-containing protein